MAPSATHEPVPSPAKRARHSAAPPSPSRQRDGDEWDTPAATSPARALPRFSIKFNDLPSPSGAGPEDDGARAVSKWDRVIGFVVPLFLLPVLVSHVGYSLLQALSVAMSEPLPSASARSRHRGSAKKKKKSSSSRSKSSRAGDEPSMSVRFKVDGSMAKPEAELESAIEELPNPEQVAEPSLFKPKSECAKSENRDSGIFASPPTSPHASQTLFTLPTLFEGLELDDKSNLLDLPASSSRQSPYPTPLATEREFSTPARHENASLTPQATPTRTRNASSMSSTTTSSTAFTFSYPHPTSPPRFLPSPSPRASSSPASASVEQHLRGLIHLTGRAPAWWATRFALVGPVTPRARRVMYVAHDLTTAHGGSGPVVIALASEEEARRQKLIADAARSTGLDETVLDVVEVWAAPPPETGEDDTAGDKKASKEAVVVVPYFEHGSVADRARSRPLSPREARAILGFVVAHMCMLAELDLGFRQFKLDYVLIRGDSTASDELDMSQLVLGGFHALHMDSACRPDAADVVSPTSALAIVQLLTGLGAAVDRSAQVDLAEYLPAIQEACDDKEEVQELTWSKLKDGLEDLEWA